jgi:hypothetical protein
MPSNAALLQRRSLTSKRRCSSGLQEIIFWSAVIMTASILLRLILTREALGVRATRLSRFRIRTFSIETAHRVSRTERCSNTLLHTTVQSSWFVQPGSPRLNRADRSNVTLSFVHITSALSQEQIMTTDSVVVRLGRAARNTCPWARR